MAAFTELVDLASERVGGAAIAANDEFFAARENLIKVSRPVFVEGRYTERGKWMDGWETRRRRTPGSDWCLLRLGLPGVVHGFVVDTTHFRGNHPEYCSIEGCTVAGSPDLEHLTGDAEVWEEILPKSPLESDKENLFEVDSARRFTHLRLHIYPDGGVARLRVHGEALPDPKQLSGPSEIDLAAMENGGLALAASDMCFGSRNHLILPGPALNMGEGWETRRRRGPGHDWIVIQLAGAGTIRRLEVDTTHFKGNYPESCSMDTCEVDAPTADVEAWPWREVLSRVRLQPDSRQFFEGEVRTTGPASHIRFHIYPDGGVARLRVWGRLSEHGRWNAAIRRLNALSAVEAEQELRRCCGSQRWAQAMTGHRPYALSREILETADRVWEGLESADWLEAFSHHPRIGQQSADRWAREEQAIVAQAGGSVMDALLRANREYEGRFGYIFIVQATGKSAEEVLKVLSLRLENEPAVELEVAAEEQRKINHLRLEKLLSQ